ERQLGNQEIKIPEIEGLDKDTLLKMNLSSAEPMMGMREVKVDITQNTDGVSGGSKISSHELEEIKKLEEARSHQLASAVLEDIGSFLAIIPEFKIHVTPIGMGNAIGFGGAELSRAMSGMAAAVRMRGDQLSYEAGKAARIGGYARREQEWSFQSN